ncbi:MAG TPA: uroporphyrinogen-III synthase [Gammaproteobacteria bacterium]|nr:uroporphyrinogen-III synthase [Gammaproteobacteria bacterium]
MSAQIPKPAARRRVLLTRSEEDCATWAARFAQHGTEAISLPCIRAEVISTPAVKAELAAALPESDWLVFTSRRGVEAFAALSAGAPSPNCRIAVVGSATAGAANTELGRVDVVGAGGTAVALAATLVDVGDLKRHPRVLLALAENAGDALERALTAAGARCARVDVYRTVPAPADEPRRPLSALRVDNVVLASPSAVTGFVHTVDVDAAVRVYTIGPSTTAAARRAGLEVTAEAREPSFEGILEAMQWQS